MKKPSHHTYHQYYRLSLSGFCLQLIFSITFICYSFFQKTTAIHGVLHALASLFIWIEIITDFKNNKPNVCTSHFLQKRCVILFSCYKYISQSKIRLSGLISALLLIVSPIVWYYSKTQETIYTVSIIPENVILFLLFISTVISIIASSFFLKISNQNKYHNFRRGAHYQVSFSIICFLFFVNSFFDYINFSHVNRIIDYIIIIFNTLLGTEIIFITILFYLKTVNHSHQYSFESYILESIISPFRIKNIFHSFLLNIFGFDVTGYNLFFVCKRFLIPFILLSIIFLLLLSSVVIIKEGEEALLLHFGSICTPTLKPGIHFKMPFPAATVHRYNTKKVRRIQVGSYKGSDTANLIFQKSTPLLWTSTNEFRSNDLLIVSSPRQMIQNAIESGGKLDITHDKTPSVSLIAADIVIEYAISDLIKFLTSESDPSHLLSVIAEAEISRRLFSYDIDTLLSGERMRLAKFFKVAIQSDCKKFNTGIEILNVAITVVHPPIEIASVFEENVSALQERETKIQQAQQTVLRTQVETAGSVKYFNTLVNLISCEENSSISNTCETESLLLMCGGDISRIIADAIAYRWEKENIERGRIDKFIHELDLYNTSKKVYCYERYMNVLEEALSIKKKIIIKSHFPDLFIENGNGNNILPSISNLSIKN